VQHRTLAGLFLLLPVVTLAGPLGAGAQAREVVKRVPPTMWSVSGDDPPCELQVYIGRINATREAASCVRLCPPKSALDSDAVRVRRYSRDEGGQWQEGAVPWAAWDDSGVSGCAIFKNWSHDRFREARLVVEERK
jgi:hypothetical protein